MDKIYLNWENYNHAISSFAALIRSEQETKSVHLVGLYRGGLPMTVHLSNILDIKMSIIDYQTRDGVLSSPKWSTKRYDGEDTIILLDDIYDSGKSIKDVKWWLKSQVDFKDTQVIPMTIIGKDNADDCRYLVEHDNNWVVFPWEDDFNNLVAQNDK